MIDSQKDHHNDQIITFFLLAILLFDDFCVTDDCINLFIKDNLEMETIKYFLSKLQELTQLDFYMLRLGGVKETLELYCHSDPSFFSRLIQNCSIQYNKIEYKTHKFGKMPDDS